MHRLQVLSRHLTSHSDGDARPSAISSEDEYKRMYRRSIEEPGAFWADMAKAFHWEQQWDDDHFSYNFDLRQGPIHSHWFKGGKTNISYNCLDRWVLRGRGTQPCFLLEGNDVGEQSAMTYTQVLQAVCQTANWLKGQGVVPGEVVTVYLPMVAELPIAMLACARIGAMHSVVFAGFSAESLAQRMVDSKSRIVLTATGTRRGPKAVPLKSIVDEAVHICRDSGHKVDRVLVLDRPEAPLGSGPEAWCDGRDVWWQREVGVQSQECAPEWMDAEAPLFLLYTSGSTGNPKGLVHTTGGFMVSAGATTQWAFDLQPGDMYWCTADCGWITGHTYITYGPLLCGASSVLFAGTPSHPDPGRCWEVVQKYKVRQFFTAPTLIRSLLQHGDSWVLRYDRSSLRVLATCGEPINEHAWHWFNEVVGDRRCPVVDAWWQTETGSVLITPFPGSWCKLKPGAATLPMFGVQPVLLSPEGQELQGAAEGILAVKGAWPSLARTLYHNHSRYQQEYFAPFKGYYFTGDGARRDADGHLWITGRVDDVINVSGHRIGTAEVEGALTAHEECVEAAVIGVDHPIKGQSIYAYVTVSDNGHHDDHMRHLLMDHVRKSIGPFAVPDVIHWAPSLPKTRSGKIMRRLLRKIAMGQEKDLGDITTLSEPGVVETLIKLRGS